MALDFLGRGLKFPFRFQRRSGGAQVSSATSTEHEHIHESIIQILGSRPGERFMRPEFGSRLKDLVFEPNDEPLWAQVRLNIGAFMQGLFRQGAFQGKAPREAYFVKCDSETTTQADINLGVLNVIVGFAPLKPAEFVVIKIQQMAGQIQA